MSVFAGSLEARGERAIFVSELLTTHSLFPPGFQSFETACKILADTEHGDERDGFYLTKYDRTEHYGLAIHVGNDRFTIYRPNVGQLYTLSGVFPFSFFAMKKKRCACTLTDG